MMTSGLQLVISSAENFSRTEQWEQLCDHLFLSVENMQTLSLERQIKVSQWHLASVHLVCVHFLPTQMLCNLKCFGNKVSVTGSTQDEIDQSTHKSRKSCSTWGNVGCSLQCI